MGRDTILSVAPGTPGRVIAWITGLLVAAGTAATAIAGAVSAFGAQAETEASYAVTRTRIEFLAKQLESTQGELARLRAENDKLRDTVNRDRENRLRDRVADALRVADGRDRIAARGGGGGSGAGYGLGAGGLSGGGGSVSGRRGGGAKPASKPPTTSGPPDELDDLLAEGAAEPPPKPDPVQKTAPAGPGADPLPKSLDAAMEAKH